MCSVEAATLWQEEMQGCVFMVNYLKKIFGPWTIADSVISMQQSDLQVCVMYVCFLSSLA